MKKELNISWCYPDMLNLHGDRGNVMALKRIAELMKLEVNITKIETFEQKIDFNNTDILLFNPGELKLVKTIVEELDKQREELDNYIEKEKVIVAIGTTGAIFSKKVSRLDGDTFSGLGYLDMECSERKMIYGDDIIYNLIDDNNVKIVGNQIQVVDTKLNSDIAFGKVEYGRGNNGNEQKDEGAKYKNLIFTNTLGPIFVKNPWLAEKLIKEAMSKKKIKVEKLTGKNTFELEKKSMACIEKFHKKYST